MTTNFDRLTERALEEAAVPPQVVSRPKAVAGLTPLPHAAVTVIALAVQAARRGHRVAFATAHQWVQRLDAAEHAGRLDAELDRLRRIPLLVCDEVGYIPFEPEAAALFYALVASRYERASLIVSSNKPFSAWTEIFGDAVAVAAMVDRLVHHAEIINPNTPVVDRDLAVWRCRVWRGHRLIIPGCVDSGQSGGGRGR